MRQHARQLAGIGFIGGGSARAPFPRHRPDVLLERLAPRNFPSWSAWRQRLRGVSSSLIFFAFAIPSSY
jgi:hypothetical protein